MTYEESEVHRRALSRMWNKTGNSSFHKNCERREDRISYL